MADFAALAKRLIDLKGRSVTLVKQGNTPLDTDQPWRGRSEYAQAEVTGMAVFTSLDAQNQDNVKRADQYMLFAASNAGGYNLEEFDTVLDGDQTWKIVSTRVIGPDGNRILYKFGVTR